MPSSSVRIVKKNTDHKVLTSAYSQHYRLIPLYRHSPNMDTSMLRTVSFVPGEYRRDKFKSLFSGLDNRHFFLSIEQILILHLWFVI